jgi:hypothetical protein
VRFQVALQSEGEIELPARVEHEIVEGAQRFDVDLLRATATAGLEQALHRALVRHTRARAVAAGQTHARQGCVRLAVMRPRLRVAAELVLGAVVFAAAQMTLALDQVALDAAAASIRPPAAWRSRRMRIPRRA